MTIRRGWDTSTRPSGWPFASLLFSLDVNPDPAGIATCVDPDTTLTTLGLVEGGNDGSLGRLDRVEFEEGTGFVTHDFQLLNRSEPLSEGLRELILGDWLGYTLDEALCCGDGLSGDQSGMSLFVPLLLMMTLRSL